MRQSKAIFVMVTALPLYLSFLCQVTAEESNRIWEKYAAQRFKELNSKTEGKLTEVFEFSSLNL